MLPPSFRSPACGVPGWMSTKKLPSRKMRGRILSCASLWIGRPVFSISIVTFAAPLPSGIGSTFLTTPISTPAMRTGDFGLRLLADLKVAVNVYGWRNGLKDENAKKTATTMTIAAIAPALTGEMPSPFFFERLKIAIRARPSGSGRR
jgi:hypothetical protein